MSIVEGTVDRLDEDFYNHGRDGLKSQFTSFLAEWRLSKEQRVSEEKSARWRRTQILTVCTVVLGTLLAWGLAQIIPAAKAILDDYYQHHPNAQLHSENESQWARTDQLSVK